MREAHKSDIDALDAIERACFVSYYAAHRFTPEQFQYYIDNANARVRVAAHGSKVAGDLIGIFYTGTRRHVGRIHSLAVLPKYRRRGIATRLVRDFVRLARQRHVRVVMLDAAARNRSIIELLTQLGFRKQRRIKSHYGPGVDCIRMRLSM